MPIYMTTGRTAKGQGYKLSKIIRIFRVQIIPDLRSEFESLFQTVSMQSVKLAKGFIGAEIGKPSHWSPNEYVMISMWADEQSLISYVGEDWNEAHIPEGMERFVSKCEVHHYKLF